MRDDIDQWATDWARERRIIFGLTDAAGKPLVERLEPRERLGKLRCTLAAAKTEQEGLGSRTLRMGLNGHPDQAWPEVYTGMALEVHRAEKLMSRDQRMGMHLHYVMREWTVPVKAQSVHWAVNEYWAILNTAKGFIRGYIASRPRLAPAPA